MGRTRDEVYEISGPLWSTDATPAAGCNYAGSARKMGDALSACSPPSNEPWVLRSLAAAFCRLSALGATCQHRIEHQPAQIYGLIAVGAEAEGLVINTAQADIDPAQL